jgi:hypothetical protein
VGQWRNKAIAPTGYLNADTMAVMQLILSDVFKDFSKLKLIVSHGGGVMMWPRLLTRCTAGPGPGYFDDVATGVPGLHHSASLRAAVRLGHADGSGAGRQHPVRIGVVGAVKGIGRRTASVSTTPSALSATRRT